MWQPFKYFSYPIFFPKYSDYYVLSPLCRNLVYFFNKRLLLDKIVI